MMESCTIEEPVPTCSKPFYAKRVEKAIDLNLLLNEENRAGSLTTSDDDQTSQDDENGISQILSDGDDVNNGMQFNPESMDPERMWLIKLLQEESPLENLLSTPANFSSTVNDLFNIQLKKKALSTKTQKLEQNLYYSTGIISNIDKYPEHKKAFAAKYPRKKCKPEHTITKPGLFPIIEDFTDPADEHCADELENSIDIQTIEEDTNKNIDIRRNASKHMHSTNPPSTTSHRKAKAKKFKDEESKRKWEDMMQVKRKKMFTSMVKKEISKQQRSKTNKHKEMLIQCKRVALQCQKVVRNKALQSARAVKELQWRMKRLARENLAYWKRSKRVDREMRRKLEKEAEEQRKMDFELIEAKRQQRKLNFLITQTELYAHFMSKKLGEVSPEEQLRILSQLDEEKIPRLINIDDYDSDVMKAKAIKNAQDAFKNEKERTRIFDMEAHGDDIIRVLDSADGEHLQPSIFRGTLKAYQLRGMNWLANLYDQGISGILADEMGLGKTVQSIAFLCHLAEEQNLWGPFLVICPASTLHNWQQEFAKFVPEFKVVPYWGNPTDRKILRQFWNHDGFHSKDASFHVVVTSYQIVISDVKYFNRVKWQYMVLDEAQAIKSTSSMRWKTLLGFNCRNRLLLSGTPIQNSMAELWALLHFIMPTLFDSHEEFNEWFSKDIESHAENKTGIDEKHLSRLHMILKPFMLRRIKKDVENELSDKIEVMVYCPLTTRQKLLYMALKQKIRIEDLLHYTVGGGDSHSVDKNFTSNLMNLVMQFRKVCNHPELFERRDAKSPVYIPSYVYEVPYLVYDNNVRFAKSNVILKYFTFTPEYIAHAIQNSLNDTIFSFSPILGTSPHDLYQILQGDITHRWKQHFELEETFYDLCYRRLWSENLTKHVDMRIMANLRVTPASIGMSSVLQDLVFTSANTGQRVVYSHETHRYFSMPETVEHRNIRCQTNKLLIEDMDHVIDVVGDDFSKKSNISNTAVEFPHIQRPPQVFLCEKTEIPSFLFSLMPKVVTSMPALFCSSRRAAHHWAKYADDFSWQSMNYRWSTATNSEIYFSKAKYLYPKASNCFESIAPIHGWSHISIPDKGTLVTDSGKLSVLDGLLKRLKEGGHRVLIYSQMTKMIDLLEEYMWHRHHKYMRLDGSSKISERRDMVADFQAKAEIFVFLLSTRAGGLGINLTAADTVIFYDSDWNPTVDQQAMDRAHRLGQTKQVTVYRLICKDTIEERILQRAREKSEIQKLVISGGSFKPDTLKPKEVVSLLLDDEEIEQKYRQRAEERRYLEDMRELDRKRKYMVVLKPSLIQETKKAKPDSSQESGFEDQFLNVDSIPNSPRSENSPDVVTASDDLNDGGFLDVEGDSSNNKFSVVPSFSTMNSKSRSSNRGSSKRGRPRGSRRMSALGRFNSTTSAVAASSHSATQIDSSIFDVAIPSTSYASFEVPSTSQGSSSGSPSVRRGPGRPRLKPTGPGNAGSRGSYRPRKTNRPSLPVSLPSDGGTNNLGVNNISANLGAGAPSYATYFYNLHDTEF